MAGKRVSVKIHPEKGSEQAYFAEQDQHKLKKLRKKAAKESNQKI